jgi:hypothetical protein
MYLRSGKVWMASSTSPVAALDDYRLCPLTHESLQRTLGTPFW